MKRRFAVFLFLSAASIVLFPRAARAHDYGQVQLAPLGFEVTQSVQTLPQIPTATGIGLSAHKPTVVRAYISATRYKHILFFHFPDFTPISVNGILTVKSVSSGTTLAVLGASNGPISVVPFASPNPANGNSSLNFSWSFPPNDDIRFELHITTSTPTITAVDPAPTTRTFVHNRRLSVRAVRLQFTDPTTGITKSPNPALVANGKDWFIKTGPLAPCKLYYWNDPTPVTIGTDLNLSCPGSVLVALDLLKNLGSVQFDNVYGWYQGALPCNGLSMPPPGRDLPVSSYGAGVREHGAGQVPAHVHPRDLPRLLAAASCGRFLQLGVRRPSGL